MFFNVFNGKKVPDKSIVRDEFTRGATLFE